MVHLSNFFDFNKKLKRKMIRLIFIKNYLKCFIMYNDYNLVSFQSMYINNNTFPELIDSLSYWDIFDESGINIGLYPMMWQGSPANFSVQNIGFNGLPSDCLYVCYNAYLYDSLYQHNISFFFHHLKFFNSVYRNFMFSYSIEMLFFP